MIHSSELIRLARKWQRKAAIRRKRISFPGNKTNDCSSFSTVVEKGYVVMYTARQKGYSFPIACLDSYIFRELLRMAEEEFGLPNDGRITIPCESLFMDYLISLIQRQATKGMEKALLASFSAHRRSLSCTVDQLENSQQSLVHCF